MVASAVASMSFSSKTAACRGCTGLRLTSPWTSEMRWNRRHEGPWGAEGRGRGGMLIRERWREWDYCALLYSTWLEKRSTQSILNPPTPGAPIYKLHTENSKLTHFSSLKAKAEAFVQCLSIANITRVRKGVKTIGKKRARQKERERSLGERLDWTSPI